MVPTTIKCKSCGHESEVSAYKKFVVCQYCGEKTVFPGFDYEDVDWHSSKYAHVKKWMDCPVCRSPNMFLGPSGHAWSCPDCGYKISKLKKATSVFWFCDACDAFLNVQEGFTTKKKQWKCTECGHVSGVSATDII